MTGSKLLLLLMSLALLTTGNVVGQQRVSYDELHTRPITSIPDKVLVTELFTTHGNAAVDGFVCILDTLPANWKSQGNGKLSVSERYSRAGSKSIRWDWKAGDVIARQENTARRRIDKSRAGTDENSSIKTGTASALQSDARRSCPVTLQNT